MISTQSERGQVLVGTVFGDGSLWNSWPKKTATLSLKHCVAQKEYVEWKTKKLGLEGLQVKPRRNGNCIQYGGSSHRLYELFSFWKAFYVDGKKGLSLKCLNQLEPLGLAVWYCDDGNYNYYTKVVTLNTQNFSKEENELTKKWFQESWNLKCAVIPQRIKGYRTYFFLNFTAKSSDSLLKLIKLHIYPIRCMRYKLGHLLKSNLLKLQQKKEKKRHYRREYYWKNHDIILERWRQKRQKAGCKFEPRWSNEEIKYLEDYFEKFTDRELGKKIGRSKPSVTQKRLRLGLRKKRVKEELKT